MLELTRLIIIATAEAGGDHPCEVLGHSWKFIGGTNASCSDVCMCSVPVHECDFCGDCDYGNRKE